MVREKKTEIRKITLPVSGMFCASCVNKVEKMKGLPGVDAVTVNLTAKGRRGPAACSLSRWSA
jgi:hypothetical protein